MRITRTELTRIIREEASRLRESSSHGVGRVSDRAIEALVAARDALHELMDTAVDNEEEMNDAGDDSIFAQRVQNGLSDIQDMIKFLQESADDIDERV